jgi:DNA-binding response OmpR family regulator
MNDIATADQPFIAIVDDDMHSARLITRMLLAHGAPSVHWLDGATAAMTQIGRWLSDDVATPPGLVIVDLKSTSNATRDFVAALRELRGAEDLRIAAVSPTVDRDVRSALIDAGADAVFQRHADIAAYRRETASIVSFWVRNQHLNAIGA